MTWTVGLMLVLLASIHVGHLMLGIHAEGLEAATLQTLQRFSEGMR